MASIPGSSARLGQGTARTARTGIWIALAEGIIQLATAFGLELTTEQHVAILGLLTLVVNLVVVQIEQKSGTGLLRDPEADPVKAPVVSPSTGVGAGGLNAASTTPDVIEEPVVVEEEVVVVEEPSNDVEPFSGPATVKSLLKDDRGAVDTRTLAIIAVVVAVFVALVVFL